MEELEKQVSAEATSQEGALQETEEVLHDDTNPLEVLKTTAEQLGVKDVHLLTEKELRSLIDREVTKAIKTREEKLKKEQEMKLLQEQGKYEEILKMERKEALEKVKQEFLEANQLEEFAELVNVDSFLDKPIGEAVVQLKDTLGKLKNYVDTLVEAKLKERISSLQRTPVPVNQTNTGDVKQILSERLKNFG
ncbi:MAG: hypothetical protein WBH60_03825 [Fervidobacterium sp.]